MRRNIVYSLILGLVFTVIGFSCAKTTDTTTASRKLYIASGLCYSGAGFTAPAVANVGKMIASLDVDTRQYEVIHDYANLSEEDVNTYPNGITNGNDGYIYIAVENATSTGNRRIDKIAKSPFGTKTLWQPTTTYLTAGVLRGIQRTADQGILVGSASGKTIERFDATPTRKESGGAGISWGANLGGACATNNTKITDFIALPKALSTDTVGKYIYAHAAVGQMDIGVVSKNGGLNGTAASCLANAPGASTLASVAATADSSFSKQLTANATPTSIVYIPTGTGTGKILVAYSTNATNSATNPGLNNALVMYDFTENTAAGETATITNGVVLYNDVSYFYGVTAMAYDSTTGYLYVSSSNSLSNTPTGYNIERFQIDLNAPSATRIPDADNSSFEESTSFNNCVTSMFVAD